MKRWFRDPVAMLALILLLAFVFAAVAAPWITSVDPYDNDLGSAMAPPSAEHWFGADDQGRDLMVRLIYGLRLTLLMGAVPVLCGGGLGAGLGLLAAFYKRTDGVIMRTMDVLLSFPAILFGLAIAAIFGPGVPCWALFGLLANPQMTAGRFALPSF